MESDEEEITNYRNCLLPWNFVRNNVENESNSSKRGNPNSDLCISSMLFVNNLKLPSRVYLRCQLSRET